MSSDRNLLFGILALQLNFVTRDQLVQGMHAWVLDKAKSLGDIFFENESMDEEQHKLLEALVDKHVEKHGGDIQQSINQLSSVDPHATQLLKQIDDSDLQATVGLISPQTIDPQADQTVDPRATTLPKRSTSRFRIIRPHARGGLGEVFLAQDTELSREVALKEIQGQYADNFENRERFMREAEITGRLEHPGIVPVYGLGRYDDGRPFYAMKFVKGKSLKEAIDKFHADPETKAAKSLMIGSGGVRLRELLGRYVDVCNAVHYAHSRGILHRDLKPGNIMIGEYGETLVVDWGLAKVIGEKAVENSDVSLIKPLAGSGSAPTMLGTAIGTPAFMSPEQAQGDWSLVDARSDVYGLGAVLYYLLTGRSPFTGATTDEILNLVKSANFVSPRKLYLAVPNKLNLICLKAMNLPATERYSTAATLAMDVQNYLFDLPLEGCPERLSDKLARSFRKDLGTSLLLTIVLVFVASQLVLVITKNCFPELYQKSSNWVAYYSASIRFGFVAGSIIGALSPPIRNKNRSFARRVLMLLLYGLTGMIFMVILSTLFPELQFLLQNYWGKLYVG